VTVEAGLCRHKASRRKLVLAVQEPALHAAAMLKRLLEERGGVKVRWRCARAVDFDGMLRRLWSAWWFASHNSVPLAEAVEAGEQNQPESAHRKFVATLGEAGLHANEVGRRNRGTVRRSQARDYAAICGEVLCGCRHRYGRRCANDGSGLSRHDLVTPRGICGAAAIRREAELVCRVL